MKLNIIKFDKNGATGSAHVRLYGPKPQSALEHQPTFSIAVGFLIKNTAHSELRDNQAVVLMPGSNTAVLVATEINSGSNPIGEGEWPKTSDYLPIIARMLANMAVCADLNDLAASLPIVQSFQ